MNTFKKIAVVGLVCAGLMSAAAQNLTTNLPTGITWVGAGGTSNAASTAIMPVLNHEEVAVQWQAVFASTNAPAAASTVTLKLGASQVPSNLVEVASITRSAPSTIATLTQNFGTNIYLGSFKYFGVMSITSTATNTSVTNMTPSGTAGSIGLQFKNTRNGVQK